MKRLLSIIAGILILVSGAALTHAGEPGEVKLRNWYLGGQWTTGERDRWDVFGRDVLPPTAVDDRGRGSGLLFGRRFGDRFLLGLQMTVTEHELADVPEMLYAGEALVTGTVLFRERARLQPFLRGGIGGGALVLERSAGDGYTITLGTAAIAGGGFQVRLGSRISLELEAVANFTNFLTVQDDPDGDERDTDWRVKASHTGWRVGIGTAIWF